MDRETFVMMYVSSFMSCYAANNYSDACASGKHDDLSSEEMILEAKTIAESTWDNMAKVFGGFFEEEVDEEEVDEQY